MCQAKKGENRGRDTEKKEKAQSARTTQIRNILHRRFHASSLKEKLWKATERPVAGMNKH